jgi:tetratricopeptide (TPR) repeat protein
MIYRYITNNKIKKLYFCLFLLIIIALVSLTLWYRSKYGNLSIGSDWEKSGNYHMAIVEYTNAIERDPNFAKAYLCRGIVWDKKGDYDKAIADFSKAIKLKTNYANAFFYRGHMWCQKNDFDRAIADFSKLIELDAYTDKAYLNRGNAWKEKEDYGKSVADYLKALEINPGYSKAYNNLAWVYSTCPVKQYRNGTKALELAQIAVKLDATPSSLGTIAAAYAEIGKFNAAIESQERAIDLLKSEKKKSEIPIYIERLNFYKNNKPWRNLFMKQTR